MPGRIIWNLNYQSELDKNDEAIKSSLRFIYRQINQPFHTYNMEGEQDAIAVLLFIDCLY
ncbi:MAG: hypothetical protein RMY29_018520 [Nostoc sp. CreGUA01]|nr:hypothetical protein [Nostoc sp. CreGUA01]